MRQPTVQTTDKLFVVMFLIAIFVGGTIRTPEQQKVKEIQKTVDSVTVALSNKQAKPLYKLDSITKKAKVQYLLSLSDFDTLRKDSIHIFLVPKQFILQQVPNTLPVKKK